MKRFSKSIFLALMIIAMAIALVGCKSASVEKGEPVEPAPVEPAPVEPAPAEPVAEQKPAELKYYIGENEITVTAADGHAVIVYPETLFSDEELYAALFYAVETYPALAEYVTYDYVPGKIEFFYPEEWDSTDYQLAEALVIGYVNEVLSDLASQISEELVSAELGLTSKYIISIYGYDLTVEYADSTLVFTYPEVITKQDVKDAAAAAYQAYAAYLEGTTLAIDDGMAILYLPYELTEADLDFAVNLARSEIKWYVNNVLSLIASPVVTKHVNIMGYDASIAYSDGVAVIDYPDFITKEEVAQAAQMAYASFAQYLDGTELSIGEGTATLKFPVDITEADLDYAVALLDSYLPTYVAAILAPSQEAAEAAAKAAEEAAAKAEAEKVAAAAKAAEELAAKEAAAKAEAEKVAKAAAEAAAKAEAEKAAASAAKAAEEAVTTAKAEKKSNVGLIIVIVLLVLAAGAACFILLKKKKK